MCTKGSAWPWGLFQTGFGALPGEQSFEAPWITSGYTLQLSGLPMERAIIRYNSQSHREFGRILGGKYIFVVIPPPSDVTGVTMQFIRLEFNNWQVFCVTAGLSLAEIVLIAVSINLL